MLLRAPWQWHVSRLQVLSGSWAMFMPTKIWHPSTAQVTDSVFCAGGRFLRPAEMPREAASKLQRRPVALATYAGSKQPSFLTPACSELHTMPEEIHEVIGPMLKEPQKDKFLGFLHLVGFGRQRCIEEPGLEGRARKIQVFVASRS